MRAGAGDSIDLLDDGDDVLTRDERVHLEAVRAAVATRVRGAKGDVTAREDISPRHASDAAVLVDLDVPVLVERRREVLREHPCGGGAIRSEGLRVSAAGGIQEVWRARPADAPELGVSRPVHQKARVPSTGMRVPLTVS